MKRAWITTALVLALAGLAGAELQNVEVNGLRIRSSSPDAIDHAEWIGMETPAEYQGKPLMPAVYLRRAFPLDKPVKQAVLTATALGLYEFTLNGQRVGDDVLAPGWTEYAKRLYTRSYDVTGQLMQGPNVLGAALGDGWYGLHHNGRGHLRLRAALVVIFEDGTSMAVNTDGAWKATMEGPVRASDIYDGETYDARMEMPGWDMPGYDDTAWAPVIAGREAAPGAGSVDVTEQARAAVKDGVLKIAATNDAFGDPAFGTVKSLVVRYKDGGDEHLLKGLCAPG